MKKINVALVGVGSVSKALVEGVSFYTKNPNEKIGLMHPIIGKYKVKDINFVCAFDVDERKVGKKLHEAISQRPNITKEICKPIQYDAFVHRGPTLDGVIQEMKETFVHESKAPVVNVIEILKKTKTNIVINLLPTGSHQATHFYAEAALKAGCSFINCIPTPLATSLEWRKKFEKKGLVLLGDDIKSQMGATMLNRIILEQFKMRGIKITKSIQENRGGNMDHLNLIYRSKSKEKSKSNALVQFLQESDAKPLVKFFYTGKPSGHKIAKVIINGEMFGRIPISITSVIEDEISINGASTIVDAVRIAELLIDRKKQNNARRVCAFLMKMPPTQMSDSIAFKEFSRTQTFNKNANIKTKIFAKRNNTLQRPI